MPITKPVTITITPELHRALFDVAALAARHDEGDCACNDWVPARSTRLLSGLCTTIAQAALADERQAVDNPKPSTPSA